MQRLRSAVELQTVGSAETDREANGRMGCWGLGSDASSEAEVGVR
jgi:hypothetical protein